MCGSYQIKLTSSIRYLCCYAIYTTAEHKVVKFEFAAGLLTQSASRFSLNMKCYHKRCWNSDVGPLNRLEEKTLQQAAQLESAATCLCCCWLACNTEINTVLQTESSSLSYQWTKCRVRNLDHSLTVQNHSFLQIHVRFERHNKPASFLLFMWKWFVRLHLLSVRVWMSSRKDWCYSVYLLLSTNLMCIQIWLWKNW